LACTWMMELSAIRATCSVAEVSKNPEFVTSSTDSPILSTNVALLNDTTM
jgi:hypothetical protein